MSQTQGTNENIPLPAINFDQLKQLATTTAQNAVQAAQTAAHASQTVAQATQTAAEVWGWAVKVAQYVDDPKTGITVTGTISIFHKDTKFTLTKNQNGVNLAVQWPTLPLTSLPIHSPSQLLNLLCLDTAQLVLCGTPHFSGRLPINGKIMAPFSSLGKSFLKMFLN